MPEWTRGSIRRALASMAVMGSLLFAAGPTLSAETETPYESTEAGHPVKIVYYIVYPVGFIIDALIMKPAYWLGRHEPFRSVFGTDVEAD
jgi:hypothetical protein